MSKLEAINANSVLVRAQDIIFSDAKGETLMLNIETSNYYGLNHIGSRIWELLAQPISVARICAILEQEFDVDAETCLRDVTEILQALVDERLAKQVAR